MDKTKALAIIAEAEAEIAAIMASKTIYSKVQMCAPARATIAFFQRELNNGR